MKYFMLLVFCFFGVQAQSLLPYQVTCPDNATITVKVYQTVKTKEWKAACLREEGVLWKISAFPHNGEKNFSYISPDGRIFLQLKNDFTNKEDIILRSWRNGEFLWEFSFQDLALPEETILQLPGKPKVWFEFITQTKDTLEIQLNIQKKVNISLVTGLPEKIPFLNRFDAQRGNDRIFSLMEGKKDPKEISVANLLNNDGVTEDYKKTVAKNIPTGVMKDKFTIYPTSGTIELKEIYQQKITILHPDTLALFVLRFCRSFFTPEDIASITMFQYSVNAEQGYYLITIHPKLPYSAKLQKLINPKFREGVDPERVCNYLRVSRDGQILGCYFQQK